MKQNLIYKALSKEEMVTDALREIFVKFGYRRYEMSNFESYDMYVNHKSFLNNSNIITFTDAQGKLKALKPDVTMSIVKNTKESDSVSKLFYNESVFRAMPHGEGIKEIKQMGVEFIGCNDVYSDAEVVDMARQSLFAISEEYVLDISHMGFVTGLLNDATENTEAQAQMREAIRNKNIHELKAIAKKANCTQQKTQALTELAMLSGDFETTLPRAKKLVCNGQMQAAAESLSAIYEVLKQTKQSGKLRIDFSITSDIDYYNGIMLHGYVKNVPSAVLVGGRYDNLMRSFSKPQCAFGFAVYLTEIGRAFAKSENFDVDTLVFYEEGTNPAFVISEVIKLQNEGRSVLATGATQEQNNLRAKNIIKINGENEVIKC